jgi:hypothetical protein
VGRGKGDGGKVEERANENNFAGAVKCVNVGDYEENENE